MGMRIPIRNLHSTSRYSLGQAQSRTEGVLPEASAPSICELLKRALDSSSQAMTGPEWNLVFSALDQIRPTGGEIVKWFAGFLHQLALICPDEVERLRTLVIRR